MRSILRGALGLVLVVVASLAAAQDGKAVYQGTCVACHGSGAAGAPKLGDGPAWWPRYENGIDLLYRSALAGKGAMPPKGGNAALSEAAIRAAVNYMVLQAGDRPGGGVAAKAGPATTTKAPAPATAVAPAPAAATGAAPAAAGGGASAAAAAPAGGGASLAKGQAVFNGGCVACHGTGVAGAPKVGDAAAWSPRIKTGAAALYTSALGGKGAMPAKGGNPALADADVRAAVDFMMAQAGGRGGAASAPAASPAPAAAATAAPAAASAARSAPAVVAVAPAAAVPAAAAASAPAAPASTGVPAVASPAGTPAPAGNVAIADANAFNRLLRAPGRRNLPPVEDGIHDPGNDGTQALQPPLTAFAAFPKSNAGNRVDWVKSLTEGKITPRYDRIDPNVPAVVMDLNIVREVKGSMPDVVYPHKQHTEWLDCSNCHPAIFIPQKGANQISMASILLGQKCGVCHGKVAFPVSECRLCHSKNKTTATAAAN